MKLRNFVLFLLATIFLAAGIAGAADIGPTSTSSVNLIPMYGYPEIQRTAEEKKADENFIASEAAPGYSREQSSKKWIELGWKWKNKGADDNAMRFFNLAWLMNPNNYESFHGFGVLLLPSKPAEATTYFEKALSLIDDKDSWKPTLMADTATSYYLQAKTENDQIKKDEFFRKANALYSESVRLNPNNRNAYVLWAASLYSEGDYTKSWQMVKNARGLGGKELSPDFINMLSKKMPEPK